MEEEEDKDDREEEDEEDEEEEEGEDEEEEEGVATCSEVLLLRGRSAGWAEPWIDACSIDAAASSSSSSLAVCQGGK